MTDRDNEGHSSKNSDTDEMQQTRSKKKSVVPDSDIKESSKTPKKTKSDKQDKDDGDKISDDMDIDTPSHEQNKPLKKKKDASEKSSSEDGKDQPDDEDDHNNVSKNKQENSKKKSEETSDHEQSAEDDDDDEEDDEEDDDEEDEEDDDEEDEDDDDDEDEDDDDSDEAEIDGQTDTDPDNDTKPKTRRKLRSKKGAKSKVTWLQKQNNGKTKFIKKKHFENILNMISVMREDDLGQRLKFSDDARDVLYARLYQMFSQTIADANEIKRRRMTTKSGKKLVGQDIMSAIELNTAEYGLMNPGLVMERLSYKSLFIYLEVLTLMMETPDKKDQKHSCDLEITPNGFSTNFFELVVDDSRQVFDFSLSGKKVEKSKPVYAKWWTNEPEKKKRVTKKEENDEADDKENIKVQKKGVKKEIKQEHPENDNDEEQESSGSNKNNPKKKPNAKKIKVENDENEEHTQNDDHSEKETEKKPRRKVVAKRTAKKS